MLTLLSNDHYFSILEITKAVRRIIERTSINAHVKVQKISCGLLNFWELRVEEGLDIDLL